MKKSIFLIILCALLVSSYYFFKGPSVSFVTLKLYKGALQRAVSEKYFLCVITYIGLYSGGVTLSLPIATLFTLAGGFLFGTVAGALYAVLSATLGGTLSFLLVRFGIGSWIQERYHNELRTLNEELTERGFFYLLALRLFVVIPFFALNLLAGLTKISLLQFILATVIGILPGSFVFAYAGKNLATLEKPSDVLSPQILGAFVVLGLFALVPLLFQKKMKKRVVLNKE